MVAQVAASRASYAVGHARRVGFPAFYPVWRRVYGRPPRTEGGALYPGYMFVKSPVYWYPILDCCSAVLGIVARPSDLEPLRSLALDRHVEKLMAQADRRGGFVEAPADRRRTSFMRGDRVVVDSKFFGGSGTLVKVRSGAAVVHIDGTAVPVTVDEGDIKFA